MTFGQGSTTNRRRLRIILKNIRVAKNLSQDDVRKRMEWSLSKVIRIENGTVGISASDLKGLLQLYEVKDEHVVAELLDLARRSRQRHWAAPYRDLFTPAYMEFLGYEDDASRITQYHPQVVPGLLQTERYAREIITATTVGSVDDDVVAARVENRLARQRRLFKESCPRRARFIVAESSLMKKPPIAPDIMHEQRQHLLKLSNNPRVEIFVLEQFAPTMRRYFGPLSLHEFDSDLDPDVVYLDNAPDDIALIEDERRVTGYKEIIEELVGQSLNKDEWQTRLGPSALAR